LACAWGMKVKHVFQLENFNISTTKTKYIKKPSSNPEHPHPPCPISRCHWSSLSERLPPAHTLRVEIWSFSQTDGSLPSPRSMIIVGRSMVNRAIIPDREVILVGPSVTNLKIVIWNTVSFEHEDRHSRATYSRLSTA